MQEASDAHSKTADSDTVSTNQVSSVQLVVTFQKVWFSSLSFGSFVALKYHVTPPEREQCRHTVVKLCVGGINDIVI